MIAHLRQCGFSCQLRKPRACGTPLSRCHAQSTLVACGEIRWRRSHPTDLSGSQKNMCNMRKLTQGKLLGNTTLLLARPTKHRIWFFRVLLLKENEFELNLCCQGRPKRCPSFWTPRFRRPGPSMIDVLETMHIILIKVRPETGVGFKNS